MKIKPSFALLSCFLLLLASCKEDVHKGKQELLVNTAEVTETANENETEYPFISQPFRTSELSFRVGGPIDRLDVYAGNRYERGSIIAEIDPRDFRIRNEQAKAVYQQAKAEFERIKVLYEKGNLSASAYEKANADYVSAKMKYETTVNELADTRLIAPFNGYIGEVYIEKYQDVKPTQPVLSLIDIDRLKIEIYVTQDIAYTVRKRDTLRLYFDACPEKPYDATIIEISKGTTRNNLSYLLTALLPNPDGQLIAGMSGKAMLNLPLQQQKQVSIPQTALCHRPAVGDYVWVVDKETNRVRQRVVTTGSLLSGGRIAIEQGLQPNETVATSGLRFLSDGTEIITTEKTEG